MLDRHQALCVWEGRGRDIPAKKKGKFLSRLGVFSKEVGDGEELVEGEEVIGMGSQGVEGALAVVLARLEAMDVRLRNIEWSTSRPGAAVSEWGGPSAALAAAAATPDFEASLAAYDAVLDSAVAELDAASAALGGACASAAGHLVDAYRHSREVVEAVGKCAAPPSPQVVVGSAVLAPVSDAIQRCVAVSEEEARKGGPLRRHAEAAADSALALSWPLFSGPDCGLSAPPRLVNEAWQIAECRTNDVRREHKGEADHVRYCDALKALLSALRDYCARYHPTGPAWNPAGGALVAFKPSPPGRRPPPAGAAAKGRAPAGGGGPPPPPGGPPPPMPPMPAPAGAQGGPAEGPLNDLFASINVGEDITKRLRKVSPGDRGSGPSKAAAAETVPSSMHGKPSPKGGKDGGEVARRLELVVEGSRPVWYVEGQNGAHDLVVTPGSLRESVYIHGCDACTVEVTGKCTGVVLSRCKRTTVVLNGALVGGLEVVRCDSCAAQCNAALASVRVDDSQGFILGLAGPESLNAQITTACTSAMTVVVPDDGEDGSKEHALPDQYLSTFDPARGTFATRPVEQAGFA